MSSNDYLYQDTETVKLDHPDSAIRLACVVHRFKVPTMSTNRKVKFTTSFATAGRHDKTRRLMREADEHRARLAEGCRADKISSERVVADARRYIPQIHNILVYVRNEIESERESDGSRFGCWFAMARRLSHAFVSLFTFYLATPFWAPFFSYFIFESFLSFLQLL